MPPLNTFPPNADSDPYQGRGYTVGEVEILLKIGALEMEVRALKENSLRYVGRAEFEPVQRLVYGMVGVILLAVVGAIVTLVLR